MARRTYSTLPADYTVCLHDDCPMAATCLHQLAFPTLQESETCLNLLNPKMCLKSDKCRFYRDSRPVVYARGFTGFQKRMFPAQYRTFMNTLIGTFGRNAYFERRRGATPLPPAEQATILAALRKAGVTEDFPFDNYEEQINYCD